MSCQNTRIHVKVAGARILIEGSLDVDVYLELIAVIFLIVSILLRGRVFEWDK